MNTPVQLTMQFSRDTSYFYFCPSGSSDGWCLVQPFCPKSSLYSAILFPHRLPQVKEDRCWVHLFWPLPLQLPSNQLIIFCAVFINFNLQNSCPYFWQNEARGMFWCYFLTIVNHVFIIFKNFAQFIAEVVKDWSHTFILSFIPHSSPWVTNYPPPPPPRCDLEQSYIYKLE